VRGRLLAAFGAVLLTAGVARGNYPVFDAASFSKLVESIRLLEREVAELEATYRALSGSRGLGGVLYNPALREYLPPDWMRVYDAAAAGGYPGISGKLRDIDRAERLSGTVAEQVAAVQERSRTAAETDKAVGLRAFDGARARLTEIESLMGKVNQTNDMKGAAEIEGRIAAEQAVVANEGTKLQLVAMLQQAEERLAREQRRDVAERILSPANTGMPDCCRSR
jgi:type IV secretion system protein VirB5